MKTNEQVIIRCFIFFLILLCAAVLSTRYKKHIENIDPKPLIHVVKSMVVLKINEKYVLMESGDSAEIINNVITINGVHKDKDGWYRVIKNKYISNNKAIEVDIY